jgi:hypothetical protein
LKLNPGDAIPEITVRLSAAVHGALPATMPRVSLVRCDQNGNVTGLASVTDNSPSTAAYQTPHDVTLNATTDPGHMPRTATSDPHYVVVLGEAGANSVIGLQIQSVRGTLTGASYRAADEFL